MPLFYHYTDDAGAINIIRIGRVLASLEFVSGGDTAYGNGVYLTQLKPGTSSKTEIAMNNWMDTSEESLKKTDNYFVFDIPESDVKDSKAKDRNIFLFGFKNDLRLQKYPWVYLGPEGYLSMASNGDWHVRPVAGGYEGWVCQASNCSLGPDIDVPWLYTDPIKDKWHKDDSTLKAYAWQI